MSFLNDIEECLCKDALISGNEAKLLKEEKTNTIIELKVKGSILHYDFEKITKPFPFFNRDKKGLCIISDHVIFYQQEVNGQNIYWAMIFELKKGSASSEKQLHATQQLVRYLIDSVNRVCNKKYEIRIRKIGHSSKIKCATGLKIKYNDKDFVKIGGKKITLDLLLV